MVGYAGSQPAMSFSVSRWPIARPQRPIISPGAAADDRRAEDAAAAIREDLDVALGPPLGARPVVLGKGPAQHVHQDAAGLRLRLARPDFGQLGVGEGHSRDDRRVDPDGQAEEQGADHERRVVARDMGELRPAGDVAHRIDAPVGGAQPVADGNALLVVGDAGDIEPEALDIRAAAGGDQQVGAVEAVLAASGLDEQPDAAPALLAGLDDGRRREQANPFARQCAGHHGGRLGVFGGKRPGRLDDRHLRAEPADTPAPVPGRPVRRRSTSRWAGRFRSVEDRLVGEKGHLREPRDGRDAR